MGSLGSLQVRSTEGIAISRNRLRGGSLIGEFVCVCESAGELWDIGELGHVLKVLIVRIRLGCQIRSDSQRVL